jgi:hypothetical protein
MRFLDLDLPVHRHNVSNAANVLPAGINSDPDLKAQYLTALDKQLAATEAWLALMDLHIEKSSPWSAILHSAEASGVPLGRLRDTLHAQPSTLSRWFNGLAQPVQMLRDRLKNDLKVCGHDWRDRITRVRLSAEQAFALPDKSDGQSDELSLSNTVESCGDGCVDDQERAA